MIQVDEALARLGDAAVPLGDELVPIEQAHGRVLAAAVHASHRVPRFDHSAADGYAVRHVELAGSPVALPVTSTVPAAAHARHPSLAPGTAARILTGGVLPHGADTVVRQELVRRHGDDVVIDREVVPGADVRWAGAEVEAGAEVAPAGAEVTPGVLGALVAAGARQVAVRRRPTVHVLVTGDEVVPVGADPALGEVPDANGPVIAAYSHRWGCEVLAVEHVPDDERAARRALDRAMSRADVVLSSGGVSVGDLDHVPSAAEAVGAERLFWKVAQRPGGPLYAARRDDSVLVGLPGNPAAVVVNLVVHARHLLDVMHGSDPQRRWSAAAVPEALARDPEKTLWTRCRVESDAAGTLRLSTLGGQDSHLLGNLVQANALARVPSRREPLAGALRWVPLT